MAEKLTKAQKFDIIINNYPLTPDEVAFLKHEIELSQRKSNGERKPTATQTENEGIKGEILSIMTPNTMYTVTDIMKSLSGDFSNQKISALLNQLVDTNKVSKVVDKRKSYFTIC